MISWTVSKRWSRTQTSRASSVAELEYHGVVTVTVEGLGMQAWFRGQLKDSECHRGCRI